LNFYAYHYVILGMKKTGISIVILILLTSFYVRQEKIQRFHEPDLLQNYNSKKNHKLEIQDTIPNKIIVEYLDEFNRPVMYSRDIFTGVCIEGECRLLQINLFWNTTGRYLGFELPPGEFLSKTEHDPFSAEEYDRLHELLTDANSALASYSLEELVPVKDSSANNKVDAVSSATIAAVLDYIVEGAVYTTYTMWHIIHGPSKREIEKLTTEKLDADLALLILNNNNLNDQVWVLNHISGKMEITPELQSKLLELIRGNDVYLAERSLNALKPEVINSDIQLELAKIFTSSGFLQKRLILQKLKEIERLNPEVVQIFSSEINHLNGTLTKNLLELYNLHLVQDDYTISEVAKLLKNDNRYISNQAFKYLDNIENLDKKTNKSVIKYKKNNS